VGFIFSTFGSSHFSQLLPSFYFTIKIDGRHCFLVSTIILSFQHDASAFLFVASPNGKFLDLGFNRLGFGKNNREHTVFVENLNTVSVNI